MIRKTPDTKVKVHTLWTVKTGSDVLAMFSQKEWAETWKGIYFPNTVLLPLKVSKDKQRQIHEETMLSQIECIAGITDPSVSPEEKLNRIQELFKS